MAGLVGVRASGHAKGLGIVQDFSARDSDSLAFPQSLCSFSGRQHPWLDLGCGRRKSSYLKRQTPCIERVCVKKKELPGREQAFRGITCGVLKEGYGIPSTAGIACRAPCSDQNECLSPGDRLVLQQFLLAVPVLSALNAAAADDSIETGFIREGFRDKSSRATPVCSSSGTAMTTGDGNLGPGMFRTGVNRPGVTVGLSRQNWRPCITSTPRLRWRESPGRGPQLVHATSHHHHWHGGGTHHAELPRPRRHDWSHKDVPEDRWRLDDETSGAIDEDKVETPTVRTVKISSIGKDRYLDESDKDAVVVGELEAAGLEENGTSHHSLNGSANDGAARDAVHGASCSVSSSGLLDALAAVGKEPMYQVMEVTPDGKAQEREVSRRQLLKCASLRLRDIRRIDPSLWVTNSLPALLVRDDAILINLGSLRAVTTTDSVLVFDHNSIGGKAFLEVLLNKIEQDHLNNGGPIMPFELEVLEAALTSRLQRLEAALMKVEPRVKFLLQVLPNKLNADFLEELRISKQALVELGSKAGALRQTLLELLEHNPDIRRITNMGRYGKLRQGKVKVSVVDKRVAEEEEQEVEMLLEYYLQRCDSIHGQSERLLDSAKEAEDSIAVNLSSRRLEVSKLELLLQVGTFCTAIGALIAGIFGMNLRSRLEEHAMAFWIATGCIIWGGVILFAAMLFYLMRRRIL